MEGKLVRSVGRVRRRQNSAGPVTSPCDGRGIDAVRGEESEDIPFLPLPDGSETLAEFNSGIADLSIGVGPVGIGVDVYYCNIELVELTEEGNGEHRTLLIGIWSVISLEEKCPEVHIGNVNAGI